MAGVSPDGKWVVFGASYKMMNMDLYVVRATGGEVRRLTQDSSFYAGQVNISPDGDQVVYCRWSGGALEICTVGMNGGTSKNIAVGVTPKWSPDGKRIGYILEPSGGTIRAAKTATANSGR